MESSPPKPQEAKPRIIVPKREPKPPVKREWKWTPTSYPVKMT